MPRPFKHSGNGARLHRMLDEMRRSESESRYEPEQPDTQTRYERECKRRSERIGLQFKYSKTFRQLVKGARGDYEKSRR